MTPRERETELTAEVERELRALDEALAGLPVDPELQGVADFARELRAERPEPSDEFAEELDAQAAVGFSGGGSRLDAVRDRLSDLRTWRPMSGSLMRRSAVWGGAFATLLIGLVVVVSVVQLGGGSVDGDDDSGAGAEVAAESIDEATGAEGGGEAAAPQAQRAEPGVDAAAGADDAATLIAPPVPEPIDPGQPGDRAVQRDAQLELSTSPEGVRRVADEAIEVVEANDGIVFFSEITDNGDETSRALLNVSVPSEKLSATLSRLSDLATVETRRDAGQDITAQFNSTRDRLKDLRAEREGVRNRLANATTDERAAELRRQLRRLDRQIGFARADKQQLDTLVERAPITLTIRGNGTDDTTSGTIGNAADDAVDVLKFIAAIAIVSGAVILPLATLLLIGWLIRRWVVDRRREQALDA